MKVAEMVIVLREVDRESDGSPSLFWVNEDTGDSEWIVCHKVGKRLRLPKRCLVRASLHKRAGAKCLNFRNSYFDVALSGKQLKEGVTEDVAYSAQRLLGADLSGNKPVAIYVSFHKAPRKRKAGA